MESIQSSYELYPSHSPNLADGMDLPLVVWLSGEEEYFSEFSLDVEQVMARLHIKRSRLNQISGRELRVGKAKLDRYIRSLYRPCDVEAYYEWTRTTLSHKKTASELEEASKKLEDHAEQITEKISDYQENLLKEINKLQRKTFYEHFSLEKEYIAKSLKNIERIEDKSLEFIEKKLGLLQKSITQIEQQFSEVHKTLSLLTLLHREVSELKLLSEYQSKIAIDLLACQNELMQELEKRRETKKRNTPRFISRQKVAIKEKFVVLNYVNKETYKVQSFQRKNGFSGFLKTSMIWEDRLTQEDSYELL